MRADELHKFSDGTLNDVQTALHDITSGIRMDYLPKWNWSKLDKQRARVMIHNIDKLLFERRLMRIWRSLLGKENTGMTSGSWNGLYESVICYPIYFQQNRGSLPGDIPLAAIESLDSHHGPSDAMHNPSQPLKVSQKTLVSFLTEIKHISIDFLTPS
ncbi:hypothetical protein Tco_1171842 [Tanacetum coccineum]